MPDKINMPLVVKANKLTLPRRAAGHKMTTKIPLAYSGDTVSGARELVVAHADSFETINYIYIVTKTGKLKGVINIKDVLRKSPENKLSSFMQEKLVKAKIETDFEQVAHLALKNNIKAVPLVDDDNHLLGVLPNDQVLAIVEHESREDLLKMSGILMGKGKLLTGTILESPISAYTRRIPWIIIGLFGGLFTARVIGNFEMLLSDNIILASFIPLVAYVANAVGSQTQTLYIRDLATQPKFPFTPYAIKQFIISGLIGVTCWIVLVLISYMTFSNTYLGFVVGLSITISIIVSTALALIIPRILVKLDLDPATGSGPFSTVLQDLFSILIYLVTASLLI